MSLEITSSQCIGCGMCAADCVCGIIAMENGKPVIPEEKKNMCVHCGHCAAICPSGALVLDGMVQAFLPPVDKSRLSEAQLTFLLKGRRAVRQYHVGEAVSHRDLYRVLEYASYAPTAHNARQVSYIIINGRGKVEKLLKSTAAHMKKHGMYAMHVTNVEHGRDTLFRGAPCLILIHAPERILSEADCATAASYIELALHSFGLGSCWAGMLVEACAHGLPEGISLPQGSRLYGALMVGYPRVFYNAIPYRSMPEVCWL